LEEKDGYAKGDQSHGQEYQHIARLLAFLQGLRCGLIEVEKDPFG